MSDGDRCESKLNIIGAGLAGLSAAISAARAGERCTLISLQVSERAQSVLAEGGINAALDTMGEDDSTELHFEETMRGGAYLADPEAVKGLVENAPMIVRQLEDLGVPFDRKDGDIALRSFGGQKKKRTAYVKSSTGKMIMSALIDEARKYEVSGLIERLSHYRFLGFLKTESGDCGGALCRDLYTGETIGFPGRVIVASGGLNGLFPARSTGSYANDGDVSAALLAEGVRLSNLEMIQYHPTTVGIPGKRMLISEAARGEGGRLFIMKNGRPWYFMEELYPELKNLMPRDVVSREMAWVTGFKNCSGSVYLDMRDIPDDVWKSRLSDMRDEIREYTGLDACAQPVPVDSGIHYFMGGIDVDKAHRTNVAGLYAAGECCSQYHGANRLGGNSMLGAIYGGMRAAESAIADGAAPGGILKSDEICTGEPSVYERKSFDKRISEALRKALGIVRDEEGLKKALAIISSEDDVRDASLKNRLLLARAMVMSALLRRESRGAHFRSDYPHEDEKQKKLIFSERDGNTVRVYYGDFSDYSKK